MDVHVAALAQAGGQRTLVQDRETPGGCSLEKHWKDGKALAKIQARPWDYVVLQERTRSRYDATLGACDSPVSTRLIDVETMGDWACAGRILLVACWPCAGWLSRVLGVVTSRSFPTLHLRQPHTSLRRPCPP